MTSIEQRCRVLATCYSLCEEATEKYSSKCEPGIYEIFNKKRHIDGTQATEKTMTQAIRCAESRGYLLPVLCQEVNDKGARSYIVTSWDVFFERFFRWPASKRSVHEYIGENYPCNPFLDIDLHYPPSLSDKEREVHSKVLLEKTFAITRYVAKQIYHLFGVYTDYTIISSSERKSKFSKHILMHLSDGTMFSNNMVFGTMLKDILDSFGGTSGCFSKEADERNPKSLFYHCFCKDGGHGCGKAECLIDMGLYKGPKQLRLLFSRKHHLNVFLLPQYECGSITDFNNVVFNRIEAKSKKEMKMYFMRNIICAYDMEEYYPVNRLCHIDGVNFTEGVDWKSRHCYGMEITPSKAIQRGFTVDGDLFSRIAVELKHIYNLQFSENVYDPKYNAETFILLYYCSSKVCEISRREHASNHCYFRVNLMEKTVKRLCMDPECKEALQKQYDIMKSGNTFKKVVHEANIPVTFYLDQMLWEDIDEFLGQFEQ